MGNAGAHIADSKAELANLSEKLQLADRKVKALTKFGSHQDNALAVLGVKFSELKLAQNVSIWEGIEKNINKLLTLCDNAVVELSQEFPELEPLVSDHGEGLIMSTTNALQTWLDGTPRCAEFNDLVSSKMRAKTGHADGLVEEDEAVDEADST